MRALMTTGAWIVVGLVSVAAQMSDEALLARTFDQYVAAYNKADAKAVSEFYAEDAVRNFGDDMIIGRAEISRRIEETFSGRPDDTTLALTRDGIKFVAPDVAVVHGTFEVVIGIAPPIRGHFMRTMSKQDGRWLIVGMHTYSYRTPPANEPSDG